MGIIYIMGQIDLLSLEFCCVKCVLKISLIKKNFVGLRGKMVEKNLIFCISHIAPEK